MVAITYNDKVYELRVLETKPGNAVSIIECDMNVEFAAPVGYSEPQKIVKENLEENMDTLDPTAFAPEDQGFVAFAGQGVRYNSVSSLSIIRYSDAGISEPNSLQNSGILSDDAKFKFLFDFRNLKR